MKNKGFTLTEVLITLGIIGVIAALTLPQLYNSTRNAHLGAQYASAISTLENGIALYMYDKNVRTLTQLNTTPTPATLLSALADGYIKMKAVQTGEVKATLPCSGGSYTLPDQSVIGACGATAINSKTPSSSFELYFLSSQSKKQDALIEGLDYFKMAVTSEGLIYIPGKDYDTNATCNELTGGKGCAGKVAMNGWKFDKKIFD